MSVLRDGYAEGVRKAIVFGMYANHVRNRAKNIAVIQCDIS